MCRGAWMVVRVGVYRGILANLSQNSLKVLWSCPSFVSWNLGRYNALLKIVI